MTWQDITVKQFQQIHALGLQAQDRDPVDTTADLVAICYNLTQQKVDGLPLSTYKELQRGLAFINEIPSWKPETHFEVDGRRYRFVYDIRSIHAARYVEAKVFSADGFVEGMHRIAASMIVPQVAKHSRRWGRKRTTWSDAEYDAARHSEYAEDILAAPITAIHGSAVFFCKVFATSIESLQGYLTSSLPETMKESVKTALTLSSGIMAGNTTSSGSPIWRGSLLSKRIASRLSNS